MCNHIKTIARVNGGELTFCSKSRHYHLIFNNIFFDFSQAEFSHFKRYILQMNTEYWNQNYPCPRVKRNIPMPTLQENLVLLFNQQEIEELRNLFSSRCYQKYHKISSDEIDYLFIKN